MMADEIDKSQNTEASNNPQRVTAPVAGLKSRLDVLNQLKPVIKTVSDFHRIMSNLDAKQREFVYDLMKGQFVDLIKDNHDFTLFYRYLTVEQCNDFTEELLIKHPDFFESSKELGVILSCLDEQQFKVVCGLLKQKLPQYIKKSDGFFSFMIQFSAERRGALIDLFSDQIQDFIPKQELFNVLRLLDLPRCSVVCKILENKLSGFFPSTADLKNCFKDLSAERCQLLFASQEMKDHLKKLCPTPETIISLLTIVQANEKRRVIYDALSKKTVLKSQFMKKLSKRQ